MIKSSADERGVSGKLLPREDGRKNCASLRRQHALRRKGYSWKRETERRKGDTVIGCDNRRISTMCSKKRLICQHCSKPLRGPSVDLSPALLSIYDKYALSNVNQGTFESQSSKSAMSAAQESVENVGETENSCSTDVPMKGRELIDYNIENCDYAIISNVTFFDEPPEAVRYSGYESRPVSLCSRSSTLSTSLSTTAYPGKMMNSLDSGHETGSRSSYEISTECNSSGHSVETASFEDETEDTVLYDDVYEEISPLYADVNIYENLPTDSDEWDKSNDEDVYSNFAEFQQNEMSNGRVPTYAFDRPARAASLKRTSFTKHDKQRETRGPTDLLSAALPGNLRNVSCLTYAQRVAGELVETEQSYVNSLQEIIMGYMHDLNHCKNASVTEEDINFLFANLVDIYNFSRLIYRILAPTRNLWFVVTR